MHIAHNIVCLQHTRNVHNTECSGADLGVLAGGVSVSRSHMSYYEPGGGGGEGRHKG